jgi:hypothetical protein
MCQIGNLTTEQSERLGREREDLLVTFPYTVTIGAIGALFWKLLWKLFWRLFWRLFWKLF